MSLERKYDTNGARQAAYRLRQAGAHRQDLADRGLPPLPPLPSMPGTARWNGAHQRCVALLTLIRDEMAAYYEDRSQTWQESDRGVNHEERMEAFADVLASLEELGT